MTFVKVLSLSVIALVLAAEFILSHVWPSLYLLAHKHEYYTSAVACANGIVSYREAKDAPEHLDAFLKHKLLLASEVELAACHDNALLRNRLLSNGVDEVEVQLIDLEALEEENLPLALFVERHRM